MSRQNTSRTVRWSLFAGSIGGAAILLAVASLASRFMGLFRDRLLATGFGTGSELDIYYAAFRIPDFIFQLLILGAISAAFIPVFAGYLAAGKRREADQVASSILTLATITLTAAAGLTWIFANQLMPLIAPGFNEQQLTEVVKLTRIMLLSPIFFGLSGIFGSILNSHHRFVAYALAPLFYNLGIIVGALIAPENGLVWLAGGVVLGALLQMLVQLIGVWRVGFRFRPRLGLQDPGTRKIFLLMLPATAGLAIVQINLLAETIIATTLREGSLAQFFLATSLAMLPVGVIGAPVATAVFPALAKAASLRRQDEFTEHLIRVIRQILFLVIPASLAIMVLRAQIVRLVYGAGEFDFSDTRYVTSLLGILAVSMFAMALIPLLTRAFYALQLTKVPVIISGVAMVVNVSLALLLSYYFGVVGLGAAFSFAAIFQVGLLLFFLSARIPELEDAAMLKAITTVVTAALLMAAAMYGTLYAVAGLIGDLAQEFTVLYFLLQTVTASLVGLIVYFGVTWWRGLPEAKALLSRLPLFRR